MINFRKTCSLNSPHNFLECYLIKPWVTELRHSEEHFISPFTRASSHTCKDHSININTHILKTSPALVTGNGVADAEMNAATLDLII